MPRSKKVKVLESLIGMIEKFPYDNPTYARLHEDLDRIRGKFKQVCPLRVSFGGGGAGPGGPVACGWACVGWSGPERSGARAPVLAAAERGQGCCEGQRKLRPEMLVLLFVGLNPQGFTKTIFFLLRSQLCSLLNVQPDFRVGAERPSLSF